MWTRLLRIGVWVVYLAGSGFLGVALTWSVYQSARQSVGLPPPPNPEVSRSDLQVCGDSLASLSSELNDHLRAVPISVPAATQDDVWQAWIPTWRARLLALAGRCRLIENTPPEALALRDAYADLNRLQGLYTTHVVQFAREIGKTADETREAITRAQSAVRSAP